MKKEKKLLKKAFKFLQKKMQEKHPTKQEMIQFCKELRESNIVFDVNLQRPYDPENKIEEFAPASYFQYLEIVLYFPCSTSRIVLSTLPYREINQLFMLNEEFFLQNGYEEDEIEELEEV